MLGTTIPSLLYHVCGELISWKSQFGWLINGMTWFLSLQQWPLPMEAFMEQQEKQTFTKQLLNRPSFQKLSYGFNIDPHRQEWTAYKVDGQWVIHIHIYLEPSIILFFVVKLVDTVLHLHIGVGKSNAIQGRSKQAGFAVDCKHL